MSENPVLAEIDRLRVELALAHFENAQLKAARLQDEAVKLRQDLEALVKGLAREGYTLNRDGAGRWAYVAVPPAAMETPRFNGTNPNPPPDHGGLAKKSL
jgi:hypothetical protein